MSTPPLPILRPYKAYEFVLVPHGGPRKEPPKNYRYTPEPGRDYTLNVWVAEPGDKQEHFNFMTGRRYLLTLEPGWLFCTIVETGSTFICSSGLDWLRDLGIEVTEMAGETPAPPEVAA